jgi:hypothetical protein
LFHTLVLFGASLTGGAVTTAAIVSVVAIAGCGDDTTNNVPVDLSFRGYPDIGVPRDMVQPNEQD